jgi:DNA replication and repair protein RecF
MIITGLKLKNFRNFENIEISSFSDGLNLFTGPNGSGKTNILEAISLVSLAKSCRGALDSEMVKFGARAANIEIDGIIEKKKLTSSTP